MQDTPIFFAIASGYENYRALRNALERIIVPIVRFRPNARESLRIGNVFYETAVLEMKCHVSSRDGGTLEWTPDPPRRRASTCAIMLCAQAKSRLSYRLRSTNSRFFVSLVLFATVQAFPLTADDVAYPVRVDYS